MLEDFGFDHGFLDFSQLRLNHSTKSLYEREMWHFFTCISEGDQGISADSQLSLDDAFNFIMHVREKCLFSMIYAHFYAHEEVCVGASEHVSLAIESCIFDSLSMKCFVFLTFVTLKNLDFLISC